jgi:hypothetical protein
VAILAGFYTTKILSICSEKKRLHTKIKEIDNKQNMENIQRGSAYISHLGYSVSTGKKIIYEI